jgi:ATP-binding cassette subfamily B protein/subfamily B ATP-binding cassette protein MsbA
VRRELALFRQIGAPRRLFALALGTLALQAAAGLFQPWPLKLLVDDVIAAPERAHGFFAAGREARLAAVLGLAAAALFAGVAAKILHSRAKTALGLETVFRLRSLLFAHLQRLSLGFHEGRRVGDTANRLTSNTYALWSLAEAFVFAPAGALLTLGGAVFLMLRLDPRLALVALAVAPGIYVVTRRYAKRSWEVARDYHEREGELAARAEEALGAVRVIQAFTREEDEIRRFERSAGSITEARLRMVEVDNRFALKVDLLLGTGTLAILGLGALSVFQGRITTGELLVFSSYMGMLYGPLASLSYLAGSISSARASLDRVIEVLDAVPEVRDRPDARPLRTPVCGEIEFCGVRFRYAPSVAKRERKREFSPPPPEGAPALDGVSFRVRPGETVAIVGPTGAGKSTLLALVPRFYDPEEGAVLFDGENVRGLRLRELRARISIVLQEPVLFDASVRENIAYGRPGASAAEIVEAARLARADQFIRALPEGYETRVGERGARLSGGERQRIAIARAFLRDAPVLLLDEPTSALDAETEAAVLEGLEDLMEGRTALLVTHRLSLARRADRVIVLYGGRIVEEGAPADLAERGGAFARLLAAANGARLAEAPAP